MKTEIRIKGNYYVVKFYNYEKKYVMYFNGTHFEGFKSEQMPHDEIESYEPLYI